MIMKTFLDLFSILLHLLIIPLVERNIVFEHFSRHFIIRILISAIMHLIDRLLLLMLFQRSFVGQYYMILMKFRVYSSFWISIAEFFVVLILDKLRMVCNLSLFLHFMPLLGWNIFVRLPSALNSSFFFIQNF